MLLPSACGTRSALMPRARERRLDAVVAGEMAGADRDEHACRAAPSRSSIQRRPGRVAVGEQQCRAAPDPRSRVSSMQRRQPLDVAGRPGGEHRRQLLVDLVVLLDASRAAGRAACASGMVSNRRSCHSMPFELADRHAARARRRGQHRLRARWRRSMPSRCAPSTRQRHRREPGLEPVERGRRQAEPRSSARASAAFCSGVSRDGERAAARDRPRSA